MPTLAEIEATIRREVPLAGEWGVEVLEAGHGRALCRLPFRPVLLRPGETVSGPALMGLADVALWAALLAEGRGASVTSTLTINFLRAVGAHPVLAEARLVKRGKRLIFGEVLLRAEGRDDLAAHVTATYAAIGS